MITKNLVVKIRNLVVNDESQPVKPNPTLYHTLHIAVKHMGK